MQLAHLGLTFPMFFFSEEVAAVTIMAAAGVHAGTRRAVLWDSLSATWADSVLWWLQLLDLCSIKPHAWLLGEELFSSLTYLNDSPET